jgi:hypothetical protein
MLILVLHTFAALCFLTLLTGWSGLMVAVLIFALGVAAAWDRALLRAGGSPQTIEILPSGEARCLFSAGEPAVIEARGATVTRYWVALRLRRSGSGMARRSLLVVAGMLPPESLRLLRLWALWTKLPGVAPRQLSGRP